MTRQKLSQYALPVGEVVFKETSAEPSFLYKGRKIVEVMGQIPNGVLVATLDDDGQNLLQMSLAEPDGLHTRVGLERSGDRVEVVLRRFGLCSCSATGK